MQKGWLGKRMRTPCFRNSRSARFTWKTPKRRTLPGERDFVSATVHDSKDWAAPSKAVTYVRNHNPI